MLQQTKTTTVIGKFEQFLEVFPDLNTLAQAPLQQVLLTWQGMGYNRRALALKNIAHIIVSRFDGEIPSSPETLKALPGIGAYTASAIVALAFNLPTVFIETNIRTVFIHFFFKERNSITDREILPLVDRTLYRENPREWYYALFDYGAMLKKEKSNNYMSAHYLKQTPFKGSNREIRSQILKVLLTHNCISEDKINYYVKHSPVEINKNVKQLAKEGFLSIAEGYISIK
jgi:A/G-specific adenine glycosylase